MTHQEPDSSIPKPGLHRRTFLQQAGLGFFLLAAGCGNGGDGILAVPDGSTFAPMGTPPTIPDVPTLTPTVRPSPEVLPGVSAGLRSTALVDAETGGQFTLPDGSRFVVPAGALAQDTEISITVPTQQGERDFFSFIFEPSGLVFSTPAFLVVPHQQKNPSQFVFAGQTSKLNPAQNFGSESSIMQPADVLSITDTKVTLAIPHFSVVSMALNARGNYIVAAIPYRYLKAGDILAYLTGNPESANWFPGHVGLLVKNQGAFVGSAVDSMVHSRGGDGVSVVKESAQHVALADGHIYLGARRAGNLTAEQIVEMTVFLKAQLGKPYSLIGDLDIPTDVLFDSWSCVGLVDVALRRAGHGVFFDVSRLAGVVPQEMVALTGRVDEIEVFAGESLEIPVYGACVDAAQTIGRLGLIANFSRKAPHTIIATELPEGATFEPAALPVANEGGSTAPGFLFKWVPVADQVGQILRATFRLEAGQILLNGHPFSGTDEITLKLKVLPGATLTFLEGLSDDFRHIDNEGQVIYRTISSGPYSRLKPPIDGVPVPEENLVVAPEITFAAANNSRKVVSFSRQPTSTGSLEIRERIIRYTLPESGTGSPELLFERIVPPNIGGSEDDPGYDHSFAPLAMNDAGDVVGIYQRFVRYRPVSSHSFTEVTSSELFWIPNGGTFTPLKTAVELADFVKSVHPGIENRADAVRLKVQSVNNARRLLLAFDLLHIIDTSPGYEVGLILYDLNTGDLQLLDYLKETGVGVLDYYREVYRSGIINKRGDAMYSRRGALASGGYNTYRHNALPDGRPENANTHRDNFIAFGMDELGNVAGFDIVGRDARALIWNRDGTTNDIHAALQALYPDLEPTDQTQIIGYGNSGHILGRLITTLNDVSVVKDFLLTPATLTLPQTG